MLSLKNIEKSYTTGDFTQKALDDVSLNFRENEFVAILGPSGSGKTTLLNIIGGLDQYDAGNLIIDGRSTKDYRDRDWDTYRNYSIGFVFQSYNLIPHQTVLNNVILALKLGGMSREQQKEKALAALEEVGLKDHVHKKPNQLSGGQMQRVAIARALVNDPEIILADEPTGALDSKTSTAIMDLLKEVASDRLVIMVTHEPELAEQYATRTINLLDGKIISDSEPYENIEKQTTTKLNKKAGMSFLTALNLSFNNLWDKKGRTLLTAFAGSIGIIGIALILALANGVNQYITNVQEEAMTSYPITINAEEVDFSQLMEMGQEYNEEVADNENPNYDGVAVNTMQLEAEETITSGAKKNDLNSFKTYLENNSEIRQAVGKSGIDYDYNLKFNAFTEDSEDTWVNTDQESDNQNQPFGMTFNFTGNNDEIGTKFQKMMSKDGEDISPVVKDNYELLDGKWPTAATEVILVTNPDYSLLPEDAVALGLMTQTEYEDLKANVEKSEDVDAPIFKSDDIIGKEYHLLPTAYTYEKQDNDTYQQKDAEPSKEEVLDKGMSVKVVGIISAKKTDNAGILTGPIVYTQALTDELVALTNDSPVIKAQLADKQTNVLTGTPFEAKDNKEKIAQARNYLSDLPDEQKVMAYFTYAAQQSEDNEGSEADTNNSTQMNGLSDMAGEGDRSANQTSTLVPMFEQWLANDADDETLLKVYSDTLADFNYEDNIADFGLIDYDNPETINIYTDSFSQKDQLTAAIDQYNDDVEDAKKITYTDLVGMLTSSVASIINVITYVLVGFVSVSLIVSAVMIGIITYISVQERTKEIGILRALGASKKNTSTMFIAENLLIGLTSGIVGIGVSYLIILIANYVIHHVFDWPDVSAYLSLPAVIILILLATLITVLGGLYPAHSAAKKDPVTALRTE